MPGRRRVAEALTASPHVNRHDPRVPSTPLLTTRETPLPAADFLRACGEVFARFGEETQDSGNISYGVEVAGRRFFVKTPGEAGFSTPGADHRARGGLLRNAAAVARSLTHRALPALHHIVEAPTAPCWSTTGSRAFCCGSRPRSGTAPAPLITDFCACRGSRSCGSWT